MYLYKYYGVFGEKLADDEYTLIDKDIAAEDALHAVYDDLGFTPRYVRTTEPDEQGVTYFDYGSHTTFYVLLPRPWELC